MHARTSLAQVLPLILCIPALLHCNGTLEGTPLAVNQAAVPGDLSFEIFAPVRGQSFDVVVSDGPANAPAAILASPNTGAQVVCPRRMAPDCLDLTGPVTGLAFADLSAAGDHTFSVPVPIDLPFDEVTLQAVAIDGTGNYLSAPTTVPVFETEPTVVSYTFQDYSTAAPLVGASVEAATTTLRSGLATDTTDSAGTIAVGLTPNAPYDLLFTNAGFRDFHMLGFTGAPETGFDATWGLPNNPTLDVLQQLLSTSLDPAKGTVIISVHDHTGGNHVAFLAGATVTLDVPAGVTLVGDTAAPAGLRPGAMTTSAGSMYFINTDAGQATPTVTPPPGYTCTVLPGGPSSMDVTVYPDSFTTLGFDCRQ